MTSHASDFVNANNHVREKVRAEDLITYPAAESPSIFLHKSKDRSDSASRVLTNRKGSVFSNVHPNWSQCWCQRRNLCRFWIKLSKSKPVHPGTSNSGKQVKTALFESQCKRRQRCLSVPKKSKEINWVCHWLSIKKNKAWLHSNIGEVLVLRKKKSRRERREAPKITQWQQRDGWAPAQWM